MKRERIFKCQLKPLTRMNHESLAFALALSPPICYNKPEAVTDREAENRPARISGHALSFFASHKERAMQNRFDERVRETVFPTRIVKLFGKVTNAETLLKEKPLQVSLSESDCADFENSEGREEAGILLDFGKEINGAARILTFFSHSEKPASVHITYGESVSEALSEIGDKNATNDHAVRDTDMLLPSYSDMTFNETGFRFLLVRLKGKDAKVSIKAITAVSVYRDIPALGSFRCDNETLNKIYDTAAYTCKLCLQNYIWDGIKRDRLVWLGDMHPEMLTIRTVFGNLPIVSESLDYIREVTPLPNWMNNMPTYSFWWMMVIRDWYFYTGDTAFLEKNRDYILSLSKQLCALVSDDGADSIGFYFLDWPTNGTKAGEYGSRALLVLAFRAAAELSEYCGDRDTASLCRKKAEILKNCEWNACGAKQTTAMMSLAGCCDENAAASEILQGGAAGFSTFMSYYLLKIAAKKDLVKALSALEEYYGAMLELGATTFWEDFNIDWATNASRIDEMPKDGKSDVHGDNGAFCYTGFRHSLCHGWSSAPTAFLAEEVMGIHILSTGCKKVEIKPNLGNLNWVKGTYPTPYGIISVECKRLENGEIHTEWTAPKEIEIICPTRK